MAESWHSNFLVRGVKYVSSTAGIIATRDDVRLALIIIISAFLLIDFLKILLFGIAFKWHMAKGIIPTEFDAKNLSMKFEKSQKPAIKTTSQKHLKKRGKLKK